MSNAANIDRLQIEVEASSAKALEQIDSIIDTLKASRKALDDSNVQWSTLKANFDGLGNLKSVQTSLKNVHKTVKESKPDYSSLSDELRNVAKVFADLPTETVKAAAAAAKAEKSLRDLSGVKVSPTLDEATHSLKELATSIDSADVGGISAAFANLPNSLQKSIQELAKAENANRKAVEGFKDLGKATESAKEKFNHFTVAAGNLISNGLQAIASGVKDTIKKIVSLDQTTEEYRQNMGRLNTAFENAGYSTGLAKAAYKDLFAILGDSGQATEAAQLLANLSNSSKDMSHWVKIAAGVSGVFGDSLPVEGLIEAANETAKVGKVTGTLADALNWVGISEDAFNEKLAGMSSEVDRNQFVMDTLANTYNDAAEAFYRNNETLVQAREQQASLDSVTGKLGETMARLKQNIGVPMFESLLPVVQDLAAEFEAWASGVDWDSFAERVKDFVTTIKDNGPQIISVVAGIGAGFVAWNIAHMLSGVIGGISAFITANEGLRVSQVLLNAVMSANPLGLIITLVAGVAAAIGTLWLTSDDFRAAWAKTWDNIKLTTKNIINTVIASFEGMVNSVIHGLNWLIGQLNKIRFDIPDWVPGIGGKSWGINIQTIKEVALPRFAEGGFPDHGQVFVAREHGPELVGQIGNRTTVANNDQIVEGIAHGVANANADVVSAIYAAVEQIVQAVNNQDRGVYLDGKRLKRSVDNATRCSGYSVSSGGVLTY